MYGCVYGHGFCVDREERGRGEPQGSPSAEAGRPFRGGLSGGGSTAILAEAARSIGPGSAEQVFEGNLRSSR